MAALAKEQTKRMKGVSPLLLTLKLCVLFFSLLALELCSFELLLLTLVLCFDSSLLSCLVALSFGEAWLRAFTCLHYTY